AGGRLGGVRGGTGARGGGLRRADRGAGGVLIALGGGPEVGRRGDEVLARPVGFGMLGFGLGGGEGGKCRGAGANCGLAGSGGVGAGIFRGRALSLAAGLGLGDGAGLLSGRLIGGASGGELVGGAGPVLLGQGGLGRSDGGLGTRPKSRGADARLGSL